MAEWRWRKLLRCLAIRRLSTRTAATSAAARTLGAEIYSGIALCVCSAA